MKSISFRVGGSLAMAAALGLAATPALARDRGWGWGWGRHDHDIDAGDVFAGLLILGGIVAVASAASKPAHPASPPPPRDPGYAPAPQGADTRPEWRGGAGGSIGIDGAVSRCTDEVSRSRGVDRVDSVNREGDGWRIAGRVTSGAPFACAVDGTGQIRSISIDGRAI